MRVRSWSVLLWRADGGMVSYVPGYWTRLGKYFGLRLDQLQGLFSEDGCGRAQTANQAAAFIEDFVARVSP
jgi:hypothetical protein